MSTTFISFFFVLLWSTGFISAKFGLPHAEPLTFLWIRYLWVIILMLPVILLTRAPWPVDKRQWLHIGITGLLVHGLYLAGVFIAIAHGLPAGMTALIVGLQPVLTAFAAALWLHEPVHRQQWLGLILGLLGVALVTSHKTGDITHISWSQLAPAIMALLGITFGTVYQKKKCPTFDLRTGVVLQFLPSLLLTALIAHFVETGRVEWVPEFIFSMFWLVFVLSFGAISLLNVLIRHGSAIHVARLFYLTPALTAFIAWIVFKEKLTGWGIIGMAVAALGVYLARAQENST